MSNLQIGIITFDGLPNLHQTDDALLQILQRKGYTVKPLVWDDPKVEWEKFDYLIIRNVWDYHLKIKAFSNWLKFIEKLNVVVDNEVAIIRENLHKFYLQGLQEKGINIIPTAFVKSYLFDPKLNYFENFQTQSLIVKPAHSASAYQTFKFEKGNYQIEKVEELNKTHDLLIQPYIKEIEDNGEWSFIYLNSKFSHAVRKVPKQNEFRIQQEYGGITTLETPSQKLIEETNKIINLFSKNLLFARVDGIEIDEKFYLMELELIEPDLFLMNEELIERFVDSVEKRVKLID